MASTPPPAAPSAPGSLLAPAVDSDRIFQFIKDQQDEDRKQFDHWFKISIAFLSLISAVALWLFYYFGGRSIEDAKRTVTAELRARIEEEFKTERIRRTITDVAREKTSNELRDVMSAEVSNQVRAELERRKDSIQREVDRGIERMISARMPPRQLPETKAAASLTILKAKPSSNTLYVDVFEPKGSESYTYAEQYVRLFQKAGWNGVKLRVIPPEQMRLYKDIVLRIRDGGHPPAWIEPIREMFQKVWDYSIALIADSTLSDSEARLIVPARPL